MKIEMNGYKLYHWSYPHVEQLEDEQVLHELPPPIGMETPPVPLEKDAKDETSLLAPWLHLGHVTASLAWLKERNKSNLLPQVRQRYS